VSSTISKANAEHYTWGAACDGWHLVKTAERSVIHERMPPGTSEARHYHEKAWQFFFILSGQAVMELNGVRHVLTAHQGIEIPPGQPHQIFNESDQDVEFLVTSVPPTRGDRVAVP